MITFLHGRLVHALPTQATIDVAGVGYEVFIPLSSYDKLPGVGQPIEILTHLHVREDAQILYGLMRGRRKVRRGAREDGAQEICGGKMITEGCHSKSRRRRGTPQVFGRARPAARSLASARDDDLAICHSHVAP